MIDGVRSCCCGGCNKNNGARCLVGRIAISGTWSTKEFRCYIQKKGIHVSVSEEVGRNSVCEIQNKRLHTSLSEKALINNDM